MTRSHTQSSTNFLLPVLCPVLTICVLKAWIFAPPKLALTHFIADGTWWALLSEVISFTCHAQIASIDFALCAVFSTSPVQVARGSTHLKCHLSPRIALGFGRTCQTRALHSRETLYNFNFCVFALSVCFTDTNLISPENPEWALSSGDYCGAIMCYKIEISFTEFLKESNTNISKWYPNFRCIGIHNSIN